MSYIFADDIAVSAASQKLPFRVYRGFVKRVLDIVLVLLISPVALPFVFTVWLVMWLGGGPGFYCQLRVGRGGQVFKCWKIRTMQLDAERILQDYINSDPLIAREWGRSQKLKNDPRITAIGHFLRKTSIDELPQLWNVLIGDMSLVGPRPFTPNQKALYDGQNPGRAYYRLRPGISGLWQVKSRNLGAFRMRIAFDETYARDVTFLNDLRILARTVLVVLRATGK